MEVASEHTVFFWQLFQPNDDVVLWGIYPGAFRNKCGSYALEFVVIEDSDRRPLDVDGIAGSKQGTDCAGSHFDFLAKREGLAKLCIQAERCSRGFVSERRCRTVEAIRAEIVL